MIAEENAKKQCRCATKTTMRIVGVGIITCAVLAIATKRIFDEIFVEDDWSDVDWGEEDDENYGVD